jgi:hypothetical protein
LNKVLAQVVLNTFLALIAYQWIFLEIDKAGCVLVFFAWFFFAISLISSIAKVKLPKRGVAKTAFNFSFDSLLIAALMYKSEYIAATALAFGLCLSLNLDFEKEGE